MNYTLPKDRLITDLEIMQAMVNYAKQPLTSNLEITSDKKSSIPFIEFKRLHGSIKLDSIVNNQTGDDFNLCIFTNQNNIIYAGFSPYIVNMSLEEIDTKEKELTVICNKTKGIYLLSSKEYEQYDLEEDYSEEWPYYSNRSDIERTITDLNINKNLKGYTFESDCG